MNKQQFDSAFRSQPLRALSNRAVCAARKVAAIRCPSRQDEYIAPAILDMSSTSGFVAYICGSANGRLLEVVNLKNPDVAELSYNLSVTTGMPGAGLDAVSVGLKDMLL